MKKLHITVIVFFSASMLLVGQTSVTKKEYSVAPNSRLGLINITEVNAGIGLYKIYADYSKQEINLSSICGIGLGRNLIGGIGIGVSFYFGGTLVPLFADFRYFFNIRETRVFVFGDGGILLNSPKTEDQPKILVSPGAGLVLPISNNLSVSFGIGLFTQFREDFEHDSFIIIKNGMTYSFKSKRK
jgi:hypothetical protein